MSHKRYLATLACVLVATAVMAAPGQWKRVGKEGDWKMTLAGAVLGGKLYTTESSGKLYVTDPAAGAWKEIGKPEFGNTKFMFAAAKSIYTIEKDGSLYKVNPADGSWKGVGKPGDWKMTIAGVIIRDRLYTVESSGKLYQTDLATGAWKEIGKPEFGNTKFMFAAADKLYTIETDGNLYAVDITDGSWKGVGKPGDWKATIAGVGMGSMIYTAESSGALYVTDPSTGSWKQLGKNDFGNTKFMFAAAGNLYTIEKDGSLYEVYVK